MMAIFGLLSGVANLFSGLMAFFQRRSDQRAGAVAQAAAETAVAVKVEAAIANAEADAPKTQAAVVAALDAGAF